MQRIPGATQSLVAGAVLWTALLGGMLSPAAAGRDAPARTTLSDIAAPRVEPLTTYRREPLPLLGKDARPLRRIQPLPRCTYLRGRRVCR